MLPKQYSLEEAKIIIDRLKKHSFEDLLALFKEGKAPLSEEIEGETAGSFLAWNPQNSLLIKFFTKILFNSPFGRWTGKEFSAPFDGGKRGKGVNLFQSRILSQRFRFDTYIKKARSDSNSCLALDYRLYPSLMSGLVDDLRKIEDGVFLGQMYYKFSMKKELRFLGYFVLCSLKKPVS